MMRRNRWLLLAIVIVMLLLINNTVYYYTTKRSLEESLSHEMSSVAKQIEISVEQSRLGAEKYQELIGSGLRTAAIAAQYALDPDIEKVSNEQLVELSERLGVLHITLLKRTENDIVLYRSSDPKQLNVKTSTWKPWYQAFNELFDKQNVTIEWGQSLKNFWTGPYEVATTDTSKVRKWGYYFDGSTNYITDPYVSYEMQEQYESITGVNKLIDQTLQENVSILEITAFNPRTFPLGELTTKTESGEELKHITQQPIIFGAYQYQEQADAGYIAEVFETNKSMTINTTINGRHVLKKFVPVEISKVASILDETGQPLSRYVLSIVSDYRSIQETLDGQFFNVGLIIAIVSLLSGAIVWIALRVFRTSRDRVVREAQETYLEEMNQLYDSIRAQRHDFINHVQTMHSMATLNKIQDLKMYAVDLSGEVHELNELITIDNPAIAALVRSKQSQAAGQKTRLACSFEGMGTLELGVKSLDLTRMLGNLIDNALDEVSRYPDDKRLIELSGSAGSQLEFIVSNYTERAHVLKETSWFEEGYTTKGGEHQGLGLSIVRKIVEQYKGQLQVKLDQSQKITIVIHIPNKK
ncbi:sensor histidine kinase [Paenibacillus sp. GCM10012307]|uniref:GHKL domain-containing protein n=1 Tax=Paenibacillus roseus TaxID=2798579 RepID=A0A934J2Y4_9BACL|nr:GHKL domain-containing protein [Paenibacillus roseus]MBJ6363796.1 GHKL domain-containing protein [Paenibacillus roseus]